ncbi:hypothetical protein [Kribbella monticola]|uniref:hypothetical protein n=1 Tax=Kribbella monticola TaxID=2185285 RepID=UPI0013008AA3|nr:hypothetical protein [Kribbella monticola]
MRFLAALLLAVSWAAPLPASAARSATPSDVVEGWKNSPVYVDPSQRSLVPEQDSQRLAARVDGHTPAIRIAVVPAAALATGDRDQAARAFVDQVVDLQQADGIYLVVFGGAVTWGSAVGVDTPIARILTDELSKHSRSDPVGTLDGVLDQLDVPSSSQGAPGWLWPVGIVLVLLVAAGLGLRWWKRRPGKDEGPALYRPSYQVLPDEADTLEERQKLALEDVTRFGEELDRADVRLDGVETTADVQAAMDAYADAGRVVDNKPDDQQLRAVRATVEYGRWRLACAQARLAGTPAPPRRAVCFFDPAHGTSVTDWMYTPPDGKAREIPVCAACQNRLAGGTR